MLATHHAIGFFPSIHPHPLKKLLTLVLHHTTLDYFFKKQGMELHNSEQKLFTFKLNINFQQNLFI